MLSLLVYGLDCIMRYCVKQCVTHARDKQVRSAPRAKISVRINSCFCFECQQRRVVTQESNLRTEKLARMHGCFQFYKHREKSSFLTYYFGFFTSVRKRNSIKLCKMLKIYMLLTMYKERNMKYNFLPVNCNQTAEFVTFYLSQRFSPCSFLSKMCNFLQQ